ncbi:MAG: hypothetical protein A2725_03880 [Candidatus Magasanikbacteria bacterium RIFCSPHIGHO2_01_FULL_33_34]|uniref:Uncharacterized protein n=1 Tax=Candidatus Magasanikbacteria bacterium RIFCSPHIGHO2_01_FULL_33_34 TaxID=1798671 RepID=A0A1F6LHQ0_9BACT|nr:MAG: hypothetical protein A2725_03880 [Candidatus Magasanikbacteria bacterium RIFCSPHIGHO2_01_FULL_33_34]OGH65109.1 MAG: hypothetical protein A3B83_03640 [Candidatus Magasanikbacteria bacterium RIFCSPHIGHO2_02_FULL_33_17]OGH75347.1 MAG: hypothetical protein A3A89_04525 [Candidatus Magasanikbacteria bacterium RIFCSPLOWO2_01_FULL_33_34]OGH81819.1 MAG: hypothetical protein A3F93_03535 [Candidatus Magasanikbacteria bacterium RIFCSPLOWO2_12_FULL_34_7]
MLNKVLKKMREAEKKAGKTPATSGITYPQSKFQGKTGFHAKKNSQEGAERQRSMGNRNTKPSK